MTATAMVQATAMATMNHTSRFPPPPISVERADESDGVDRHGCQRDRCCRRKPSTPRHDLAPAARLENMEARQQAAIEKVLPHVKRMDKGNFKKAIKALPY